jgi:hypothetical protein
MNLPRSKLRDIAYYAVILNEVKNLALFTQRPFAALRVTAKYSTKFFIILFSHEASFRKFTCAELKLLRSGLPPPYGGSCAR